MIAKLKGEFHHFDVLRQNIDCKQKKKNTYAFKKCFTDEESISYPTLHETFPMDTISHSREEAFCNLLHKSIKQPKTHNKY